MKNSNNKSPGRAAKSRLADIQTAALQALQAVREKRAALHDRLDAAAEGGDVPDGLVHALIMNWREEESVKADFLSTCTQMLSAVLHRLNSRFPEAGPEQPRRRAFPTVSDVLRGNKKLPRQ